MEVDYLINFFFLTTMDPNSCHQENLAVPLSSLNRSFNCYWRIFLRIRDKMQVEGGGGGRED